MSSIEVTLPISTFTISTSILGKLNIIISSFVRKWMLSFIVDSLPHLMLVFPELFEVQVISITSPDITALPNDILFDILVIQVVSQNTASILVNCKFLILVPSLGLIEISITNHDLIPELLVIPECFHFTKHFHEFIFSPVN